MPHLLNRASVGAALLLVAGCGTSSESSPMDRDAPAQAGGPAADWVVLFDGTDLDHWRGYRRQDVPAGWSLENGTLAFTPGGDGGDLITREQFGDFELELEWRISEAGNSGIMYRVSEDQEHTYLTGPEMQVLDDDRHPDGQIPSHRAGALYDLTVPPEGITRPVGEWNQVRIVVDGKRIQHWLNGHQTTDVEIGSAEWNRLVADSKWSDVPTFASQARGHIALQDHDDPVWFRNIRIRPLGGSQ